MKNIQRLCEVYITYSSFGVRVCAMRVRVPHKETVDSRYYADT